MGVLDVLNQKQNDKFASFRLSLDASSGASCLAAVEDFAMRWNPQRMGLEVEVDVGVGESAQCWFFEMAAVFIRATGKWKEWMMWMDSAGPWSIQKKTEFHGRKTITIEYSEVLGFEIAMSWCMIGPRATNLDRKQSTLLLFFLMV